MNTYIEVCYISEEGLESCFGVKITAEVKPGITAIDAVKKFLPDCIHLVDAKYITEEKYKNEYGEDEDE